MATTYNVNYNTYINNTNMIFMFYFRLLHIGNKRGLCNLHKPLLFPICTNLKHKYHICIVYVSIIMHVLYVVAIIAGNTNQV